MTKNTQKPTWKERISDTIIVKEFPRLPTGIFELDYALGGGFPIGVTSNLFGVEHSFKTGILLKLVSSAQKWCWKCDNYEWDCICESGPTKKSILFVDAEVIAWDWAERLGVNLDDKNLYIVEPAYGEEAVEIVYEALKDSECGLVIVDSISRLLPKEEIDAPAGDYKVGIRAKLHTQLINKVKSALIMRKKQKDPAMFVATTQIRANIGGATFFTDNIESSAPHALKHDWHLSIQTNKLSPQKDEFDSKTNTPYVGRFKATISSLKTKRKMFVLSGSAYYRVVLHPSFGRLGEILDYNTFKDVAFELYGDKPRIVFSDDLIFDTRKQMIEFLQQPENERLYLSLKKKVIEKVVTTTKNYGEVIENGDTNN
ncbi:hypothetical protein [Thermoanaerobacter sp. A7A]|uniref:hypothetical protein n=1 Tax=Thermoanaerobacter sp. A7A TaxID=1350366 RepID=UPI00040CF247|nr:hypothetical protein [Thermoanaerobacter sp. A7A]